MAIDIRANVTCSLGVPISGNIGDDYIQESGLIKTAGSVEIAGIITPQVGTEVTFSYTKNGSTQQLPRKLRVMSSFADPFRRTTRVELGCKLTYFSDLREPLNWTALDDPENAGKTEDDQRIVTIPIYAKSVAAKCCQELGLDPAPVSVLTNAFSVAAFDFGAGYVQVLSDLLVSECYCGYLNGSEQLVLIDLNVDTGSGPVFSQADIIDLGPIGVGQLPGEAVIVEYSTLKLNNSDGDNTVDGADATKLWEESQASNEASYLITYGEQNELSVVYTGLERSVSKKEYTTINGKNLVSVEASFNERLRAGVQGSMVANWLTNGVEVNGNQIVRERTDTVYTYDESGNLTREETTIYGEFIDYLGKISLPGVYPDGSLIPPSYEGNRLSNYGYHNPTWYTGDDVDSFAGVRPLLSFDSGIPGLLLEPGYVLGKTITTYERPTDPEVAFLLQYRGRGLGYLRSEEPKDLYTGQTSTQVNTQQSERRETVEYRPWVESIEGQQAQARIADRFQTAADAISWIENTISEDRLVLVGLDSEGGFTVTLPDSRPSTAELNNSANGQTVVSTSEVQLALGSAEAQRRVTFQLPLAPDDIFTGPPGGPYTASASDAPQKATNYGRVQNRILLGNRSGMNLQLAPERLPQAPFALMYVEANGLTALYRANGNQWALSSEGIACSTDALFWGAVGGTGVFWFPVAPGVVTLPTTPPAVDGEITITDPPVKPYNETVTLLSRLRVMVSVLSRNYSVIPSETAVTVPIRTVVGVLIPVQTVSVSILAQPPATDTSTSIGTTVVSVSILAQPPAIVTSESIGTTAVSVAVIPSAVDVPAATGVGTVSTTTVSITPQNPSSP